jgi:hypothetical protein
MADTPQVDAIIRGGDGKERVVTVAKSVVDRWPDHYLPASQADGRPTAAAKRLGDTTPAKRKQRRNAAAKRGDAQTPGELPAAGDTTTTATADVNTTAASAADTEGATA